MLRVSASNQAAADSLNEMLDLHSSGEIGLSFFVNGTGSDWQEWKSLAVLPVGYFGTADRLAGLGGWLSHVWIGPDGDVSRAGTEPAAWSFPRYIHGLEYMKGYEFNSNGDTQGWTLANSPASTPNGGTWLVATPNPDPQMERGGLSFDTSHADPAPILWTPS